MNGVMILIMNYRAILEAEENIDHIDDNSLGIDEHHVGASYCVDPEESSPLHMRSRTRKTS